MHPLWGSITTLTYATIDICDYHDIDVDICDVWVETFATRCQRLLVDYLRSTYGNEVANWCSDFGQMPGVECVLRIAGMVGGLKPLARAASATPPVLPPPTSAHPAPALATVPPE